MTDSLYMVPSLYNVVSLYLSCLMMEIKKRMLPLTVPCRLIKFMWGFFTLFLLLKVPLPSRPPWWELFDSKMEDIEVSV